MIPPTLIPRLTLDTNVIQQHWRQQAKASVVRQLINLALVNAIDLAVTARIREDVPDEPLASEVNRLNEIGVNEVGTVARADYAILDRDLVGSDAFVDFEVKACELVAKRLSSKRVPDWRDLDHLHAHMLHGRDVFLTWDVGILCLEPELRGQFGIQVMRPEDWLARSGIRPRESLAT